MNKLPLILGGAALVYFISNSKKQDKNTESQKDKPIEYPNGFIVEDCKVKISNRDKAMTYGYMIGKLKTENQFNNGYAIDPNKTLDEIIDANCLSDKNDPKVLFDSYESSKFIFDLSKHIFSGIISVIPDFKEELLNRLIKAKEFIGSLGYNTTDFAIEFPKKS